VLVSYKVLCTYHTYSKMLIYTTKQKKVTIAMHCNLRQCVHIVPVVQVTL